MGRLEGKTVVISGASQGIGRAIAERFLEEGAKIVYSLDVKSGAPLEGLVQLEISVTDRAACAKFAQDIKAEGVDVLINNAGITKDALLNKMEEDAWDAVININLKGVFNLTQAIAPIMVEAGKGAIINISSVVGEYGNVGQTNYAATKAGVIGMTYTWAKEFTRKGAAVRTNAIAPGFVMTDMMKTVPEKVLDPIRQKTPLGRLAEPVEIANAALFLASDEASFVNGHVLAVNGGLRL